MKKLSYELMLNDMFELQGQFNSRVDEDWLEKEYNWRRALRHELCELQNHIGWKWWADFEDPNMPQIKLELVDVWAFGLSHIINKRHVWSFEPSMFDEVASQTNLNYSKMAESLILCDRLMSCFSLTNLCKLTASLSVPFEELYKLFVGKTALNHVRQDNGYKEGSYQKIWKGREDNEHLSEVLQQYSNVEPNIDFFNDIKNELQRRYNLMVIGL